MSRSIELRGVVHGRTITLGTCAAVFLLGCLAVGCGRRPDLPGGEAPESPDAADVDIPRPLPETVVAGWKKVGAEIGWEGKEDPFGQLELHTSPKKGDVPSFSFWSKPAGAWGELPVVDRPFGLFIGSEGNADLKGITALERLQSLCLGAEVTDAGLKELAGLKQLQSLDLSRTKVTDAGLKELAHLEQLQYLDLFRTRVTDAGVKEITDLKRLQFLNLGGTGVTDAGLKELTRLKQLQSLGLGCTEVTDAVLKELTALKRLQYLDLSRTKVTAAGERRLQRALPGLRVWR